MGSQIYLDLTFPVSAKLTGIGFNKFLQQTFGDILIEDLWIPYFNITADVSVCKMRVHDFGCLWRYVRASMSIGGYMPPLCDPEDGHLLLDGGYVNNVPADVMHERASGPILAHDVGARFDDEPPLYDYGDYLSGWSYQLAKLVPFSRIPRVLKPEEIQLRLGSVACYSKLREVSEADYCDLIRLPQIENYGTFQFHAFEEIRQMGYQSGKSYFSEKWKVGPLGTLYK